MAVLKCKMCGGDIEVKDESYGTCDSCGSTMTLPRIGDDQKANLFNRANHFRRQNDFDKAVQAYENILNQDNSDAEAHWGCVLSRYGIEYVEDPSTHNRMPTCHRVQNQSILSDADYLQAIENAPDGYTRSLYEEEAKTISNIQKEILAISNMEEPYDVFICYKETSESGTRTKDSALAQEIYYQLKNEGYKAFFARITLEDKLGREFEPYIFAALNSAKVMLVIGTKHENINAVWVKNEWSRYLKLMSSDRSKLIIPCYSEMDAYDLPEDLSMFQSQDMSKIGFVQDLVRGIKKVVAGNEVKSIGQETVIPSGNNNLQTILKRAFMFLEDGDFKSADEYCEKVLDIDPENAMAYVGKLMSELQIKTQENLMNCRVPFDANKYYKKVVRFGDNDLKECLKGYITTIKERKEKIKELNEIIKERIENERLEKIYTNAVSQMKESFSEQEFETVAKLFESISHYKDSADEMEKCNNKILELKRQAEKARIMAENKVEKRKKTARISKSIVAFCVVFFVAVLMRGYTLSLKPNNYSIAMELYNNEEYEKSCTAFEKLGDYKDSEEKANQSLFKWIKNSSYGGSTFTVTLRTDGTVVATGNNEYGQCDVSDWKDIVAISTGSSHTVGLKQDGTVVAVGSNSDYGLSDWKDIVAISAGSSRTVGLKKDGTVVAVGSNYNGECDVSDWKDIVAISAGDFHTVGLKKDGTVVATGNNEHGACDVSGWKDIVEIVISDRDTVGRFKNKTVGLKSDGTVVKTGSNSYR